MSKEWKGIPVVALFSALQSDEEGFISMVHWQPYLARSELIERAYPSWERSGEWEGTPRKPIGDRARQEAILRRADKVSQWARKSAMAIDPKLIVETSLNKSMGAMLVVVCSDQRLSAKEKEELMTMSPEQKEQLMERKKAAGDQTIDKMIRQLRSAPRGVLQLWSEGAHPDWIGEIARHVGLSLKNKRDPLDWASMIVAEREARALGDKRIATPIDRAPARKRAL